MTCRFPRALLLVTVMLATSARAESPAPLHGKLRRIAGVRVLHAWGTPYEMGYAHGALLRERILDAVEGYALARVSADRWGAALALYAVAARVPPSLLEEARGVLAGMTAAGGARVAGLGRALTVADLLLVNAITDLVQIGCSSLSAWGEAGTPSGEVALVRNLDWEPAPALLRNQVVFAWSPSDPGAQPVVSVGFAGYLGCLSCMNAAGVTATFNMGHNGAVAEMPELLAGFSPSNLLVRDALQRRDVDGDGRSTKEDVVAAVRAATSAGSWLLHVVEPRAIARAGEAPAVVLEVDHDGVTLRGPGEDPSLGTSALAVTNHARKRRAPATCERYAHLQEALAHAYGHLDAGELWRVGAAAQVRGTIQAMLFLPAERSLRVRLRKPDRPFADSPAPVDLDWDALFSR